jgi:murein DD-endopeptidase MepM/ murein hydrolase activator NlpD
MDYPVDGRPGPTPAPEARGECAASEAATAAAATPKKRGRSTRRSHFSVLIVRGDGERVVRLNVPRPAALAAGVGLALAVSVTGVLLGDWVKLRELTREAVTFQKQIQEQHATINAFQRRIGEIRQEMAGWRELHARIWEPFGPALTPNGRDRGIGGGTPTPDATQPARLSPADELNRLGESVKEQTDSLRALERFMSRAGRALATLPSRWPVRGAVNSEYGNRQSPWHDGREFHSGLDIRAGRGTPVNAPAAGTVVHAGPAQDYGITVIVDHGRDIRSLYGHLSKTSVQVGQRVERGTVLGLSGNTGRSSGPHLHYEVHVKGQAVNPRAYLWD